MIRRPSILPLATALVTLIVTGCSDPSAPTAPTRAASPPTGPALAVGIVPRAKVLYTGTDDSTIVENPQILSVGDGEFTGNVAYVEAGSSIGVSGSYSGTVPVSCGDDICGSPNIPYIGWVSPQDGQPNEFVQPNLLLARNGIPKFSGTFTWTTVAPMFPGRYAIGAAQKSAAIISSDRGQLGFDLVTPDLGTKSYASFVIFVLEPSIQPQVEGTAGAGGWFTSDVKLSWKTLVQTFVITSTTGCDPATVSADTPGKIFTCTVDAGDGEIALSKSKPVTIKRDATAPTVTITSVTPNANATGWNNADVTVAWSCTDETSGPQSATGTKTVSTEGASQSVDATCADLAGNTAAKTQSGIKIDKTAPALAPSLPSTEILQNAVVSASPNASDALSGIASATCDAVVTSQAGGFLVNCTATDNAGNTATKSVSYTVKAVFSFSGFRSPIAALPTLNSTKAGSSVPVKFSLAGNKGLDIFAAGSPSSKSLTCSASATVKTITETAAGGGSGGSLTYDPLTDVYTYAWKTDKAWAGTCRTLVVKLTDGIERTANFQFKK
jgi:hypothetical protein